MEGEYHFLRDTVVGVDGMVFSDIRNGEVSDLGDYAWAAVRESVI